MSRHSLCDFFPAFPKNKVVTKIHRRQRRKTHLVDLSPNKFLCAYHVQCFFCFTFSLFVSLPLLFACFSLRLSFARMMHHAFLSTTSSLSGLLWSRSSFRITTTNSDVIWRLFAFTWILLLIQTKPDSTNMAQMIEFRHIKAKTMRIMNE